MKSIRVLLADDHTLVRSGIRLVLQSLEGVEVVAEAADGRRALELVENLRPDVVLLDISMPELNGIETAMRIRDRFAGTRVIMLSMHAGTDFVTQAFRAGASGYLLKDATPAELDFALRAVATGETYLTPRASSVMVEKLMQSADLPANPLDLITPRQREILQLIGEGRSTTQIAARLGVNVKTVENHRAQLMERLGLSDFAGIVRFAVRAGLVREDG